MTTPRSESHPLPSWGLRRAVTLWPLVLAVWLVPLVLALPPLLIASSTVLLALGRLPASTGLPLDELVMVVFQACRGNLTAILSTGVASWIGIWQWTIVWHAGLTRWQHWGSGARPRVAEIVGFGLLSWWPYLRLSVLSGAALAIFQTGLWWPLLSALERSYNAGADDVLIALVALGLVLSVIIAVLCWSATLWAAWLLSVPGRRSAARAWVDGLVAAVRRPLRGPGVVLLWVIPGAVLALLPMLLGWWAPALRGGVPGMIVSAIAGLGRSFCAVALFASFAPVTGLWTAKEERPQRAAVKPAAAASSARRS